MKFVKVVMLVLIVLNWMQPVTPRTQDQIGENGRSTLIADGGGEGTNGWTNPVGG